MNKSSIIFVCSSEEYARFRLLCSAKGLSNARLFIHMLHKFPLGKHIVEFDELPIDSKQERFSLVLNATEIKKLDSLCKIYGLKRPLMFKILLSWYDKSSNNNKPNPYISNYHP